jgi:hypothetical protein
MCKLCQVDPYSFLKDFASSEVGHNIHSLIYFIAAVDTELSQNGVLYGSRTGVDVVD